MRKLDRTVMVLAALMLAVWAANALGWNLFLYVNCGERDLVLGVADGMSHDAWADRTDFEAVAVQVAQTTAETRGRYRFVRLLDLGPLYLFAETRMEPMRKWTVVVTPPDPYLDFVAIEFPWVVLIVFLLAVWSTLRGLLKTLRTIRGGARGGLASDAGSE